MGIREAEPLNLKPVIWICFWYGYFAMGIREAEPLNLKPEILIFSGMDMLLWVFEKPNLLT